MLPIPIEVIIYVIALHFGMSLGWHMGRGFTTAFRESSIRRGVQSFLLHGLAQYTIGVGLVLLSVIVAAFLILSVEAWILSLVVIVFGVGIGMAYDDKENHPPEGMFTHMYKKFRGTLDEVQDVRDDIDSD